MVAVPAGQVAVITDSAACLPPDVARAHQVIVVPLRLITDGQVTDDTGQAEIGGERRFTTARPAPGRFAAAYRQAVQAGATAVVCVHLPRTLSGTISSAELAASAAGVPVQVVDSQSIGLGLGLCVIAAARAAAAGLQAAQVAAVAAEHAQLTRTFFAVDGTGGLLASGRLAAGADRPPVLFSRPVLELAGGQISLIERVRTRAVADERLAWLATQAAGQLMAAAAPGRSVDIAVQHGGARQRAESLASRLARAVPNLADLHLAEGGAVLSAHAGPGMLAVTVAPHSGER